MASLHIIEASTSGHTSFVLDTLASFLVENVPTLSIERQRAELTKPEDLLRGDTVLLACGTWNTGGTEGQLNPHMHALLKERAAETKLGGKRVLCIALGDDRYRYTCNAAVHLQQFVIEHGGEQIGQTLRIINEPYGQEDAVRAWGATILPLLS